MSRALGHISVDAFLRGEDRPSRMDEERRAYLEQQRLIQRDNSREPHTLARARITTVAHTQPLRGN